MFGEISKVFRLVRTMLSNCLPPRRLFTIKRFVPDLFNKSIGKIVRTSTIVHRLMCFCNMFNCIKLYGYDADNWLAVICGDDNRLCSRLNKLFKSWHSYCVKYCISKCIHIPIKLESMRLEMNRRRPHIMAK